MKPNFALSLSFDGIGLLHRVPGGWHMVGDVALDAPDLARALAVLRRTAVQLDTAGLRSKLVIPNEQIRYLRLPAPPRGADMAAVVVQALDGTTPYDVADLSYDWIVVGADLHIAAVARETLEEAEVFATEHDFCPVSFVAIPAHDSFPGEPFFGQTKAAAALIPAGERLMRDTHAIRILGRAETPDLSRSDTGAMAPDAGNDVGSAPAPRLQDEPDTRSDQPAQAVTAQDMPAAQPPFQDPVLAPVQDPVQDAAQDTAQDAARETVQETVAVTEPQADSQDIGVTAADATDSMAAATPETAPETAPESRNQPRTWTPADISAQTTAEDSAEDSAEAATDPAAADPAAPAEDSADLPLPAFSSRRTRAIAPDIQPGLAAPADPPAPAPEPDPAPVHRPVIAELPPLPKKPRPVTRDAAAAQDGTSVAAPSVTAATATATTAPTPRIAAPDPSLRPTAFRSPPPPPAPEPATSGHALSRLLARLTGRLGIATAATVASATVSAATAKATAATADPATDTATAKTTTPPPPRAGRPAQPRATAPDLTETQRLTVFGARRAAAAQGLLARHPRHMAMIAGGAALLLVAVAVAWSAIFSDNAAPDRAPARDQALSTPGTAPLASDRSGGSGGSAPDMALIEQVSLDRDQTLATLPDDVLYDDPLPEDLLPDGVLFGDPLPQEAQAAAPLADDAPTDTADTPAQTPAEALATYAATGIWLMAPDQPAAPPAETLDTLYLASIDTRLQNFDAVALPDGRSALDQRPATQSSPAPPGLTYDLDDRGLVIATPEGARTPEGAVVYTGRPAVTPTGMPTRFDRTPGTEAEAQAAEAAPATDTADEVARTRPQARPDTLIETNERAQLGGLSRNELAALRPRPRPETLAAVALALREAETAAAEAEAAEDEADALDGATERAIASSLKPLARPRDFASTVQTTRQSQQIAPQQAPQPAPEQVASAAALSAPRSAAPQIPSSASVAQQATVRGAINLRQVNLIGVYGQPSNRRALVRLGNGRYQKVQVGDRLDGGQVRAISENELSYVKGNRAIVLSMPRG